MNEPTILVVDDEPSIVKLVTATLESRGYHIIPAYDGDEALVKARNQLPDLILLDIMMPHVDGREVRKRLLDDPKTRDIPVIHDNCLGDRFFSVFLLLALNPNDLLLSSP